MFFILIVISTDVAPGAVDDNDTVAANGGISETNPHSEQKSIAATALELLEYVATDTIDRAWRAAGVCLNHREGGGFHLHIGLAFDLVKHLRG